MVITGKDDGDNGIVEFQFYEPDNRTKWEAFQKAIYDKSSNQFLGRTPKNWGQLFVFYTLFYIVLAALFAVCMQGLFATLNEREPRWKLKDSLIGVNPGLGFRPISEKTEEGSLIWYNISNHTTITKWVGIVDQFLEPYNVNKTHKNFVSCNKDKRPGDNEVCETPITQFGNCTSEKMYGYGTASPCVFLKLNRIIDWVPQYFTTPQDGMPEELKNHIKKLEDEKSTERMVWVTCNGVDGIDNENVKGFKYYPKGFASSYYPYKNVENYLSPIVAVEILDITPNIIVSIECRAWAQNIEYRGGSLNRAGSVRFEIQVDDKLHPSVITIPRNSPLVDVPKTVFDAKSIVKAENATPVTTQATINATTTTTTTTIKTTVFTL